MTLTQPLHIPLSTDEEALIAQLARDPRVSNREVARLQDPDPEVARRALFFVTRDLAKSAKQPAEPTLHPLVKKAPKPTFASSETLVQRAVQLNDELTTAFESASEVLAERIYLCLCNYTQARRNPEKLRRWLDKAQKLLSDVRRNPMLREPSEANVNWDASGNIGAPGSGRPGGKTSGKKCKKNR